MRTVHARDLDLNLLPVLVAVADTGSVTDAAARLYLTQSAVSAALGRLKSAIGESLVIRHGRGVVLSERGARLVAEARPHLDAIPRAASSVTRSFASPVRNEAAETCGRARDAAQLLRVAVQRSTRPVTRVRGTRSLERIERAEQAARANQPPFTSRRPSCSPP